MPEHGISELFLFVGTVLEPRVAFDITRVDFGAIMLGSRCTETVHLVNSRTPTLRVQLRKTRVGR